MSVLKYSAAVIALGIFASPAFADCQGLALSSAPQ